MRSGWREYWYSVRHGLCCMIPSPSMWWRDQAFYGWRLIWWKARCHAMAIIMAGRLAQ